MENMDESFLYPLIQLEIHKKQHTGFLNSQIWHYNPIAITAVLFQSDLNIGLQMKLRWNLHGVKCDISALQVSPK